MRPVDFRDAARLDTSQIDDARGRRGAMPGLGRGMAIGGGGGLGVVGLLVYLAIQLAGGGGADLSALGAPGSRSEGVAPASDLAERCQTGADAEQEEDCLVVAVVNSVQEYWTEVLPGYRPSDTQLFSGRTTTGCGSATSAVGPFYCPADDTIYIDLGFFDELSTTYGASSADFAKAYVVAHEYGHHVQDLLGTSEEVQRSGDREGPQSASVRLELQADCYAGAWARGAVQTSLVEELTQDDIRAGLSAAAAVGDDRIQQAATGRIDPEGWTHGSSEQRQRWFLTGYETGDPADCDTFTGSV